MTFREPAAMEASQIIFPRALAHDLAALPNSVVALAKDAVKLPRSKAHSVPGVGLQSVLAEVEWAVTFVSCALILPTSSVHSLNAVLLPLHAVTAFLISITARPRPTSISPRSDLQPAARIAAGRARRTRMRVNIVHWS